MRITPCFRKVFPFEEKFLFYAVKNKEELKNKNISIFGGGDSALDWAIELSNTSKVNLIHRRDGFSGAESSVQKVKELNDQGKLNLYTKYQMDSVSGDNQISTVKIKHDEGEIKELPYRSTIIDFAYSVHTDVGNKCTAAKINDLDVPLSTTLSSGQTVEIITNALGKPNPSWLEFVVTAKARANIKSYLKNMQTEQASDLGLRILDKALNDYGTSFTEIPYESIRRLLNEYNLKDEKTSDKFTSMLSTFEKLSFNHVI